MKLLKTAITFQTSNPFICTKCVNNHTPKMYEVDIDFFVFKSSLLRYKDFICENY